MTRHNNDGVNAHKNVDIFRFYWAKITCKFRAVVVMSAMYHVFGFAVKFLALEDVECSLAIV